MSCKTPARLVSDLWEQFDEIAEKYGAYAELAGRAGGEVPEDAEASDVVEALRHLHKLGEAADEAIGNWNERVGNTWAHIGPRRLILNEPHQGTIQSATSRTFVTPFPCEEDSLTIDIKERGGVASTEVNICRVDAQGDEEHLAKFRLNENRAERQNKQQEVQYTVNGVGGFLLVVSLRSRSVFSKFSYSLQART